MKFFEFVPEGSQECRVRAWLHGNEAFKSLEPHAYARPAIIICPGGAYRGVAEVEAEPVAKCFFAAGYNTFILNYSGGEKAKNFYPLCQLASTIAHIRKYSAEWNICKDKIAVSGFSAGGHLAGSLGTMFNEEKFLKVFGREDDIRPNAMVLGYPVITADEFGSPGCIGRVSGAEVGSDEFKWFGLDQRVDSQTPPTFLWHTAEDEQIKVENSLKMAMALSAANVPFELHVFPHGLHGMSVCNREVNFLSPYNARWIEWSIRWLNELFEFVV